MWCELWTVSFVYCTLIKGISFSVLFYVETGAKQQSILGSACFLGLPLCEYAARASMCNTDNHVTILGLLLSQFSGYVMGLPMQWAYSHLCPVLQCPLLPPAALLCSLPLLRLLAAAAAPLSAAATPLSALLCSLLVPLCSAPLPVGAALLCSLLVPLCSAPCRCRSALLRSLSVPLCSAPCWCRSAPCCLLVPLCSLALLLYYCECKG